MLIVPGAQVVSTGHQTAWRTPPDSLLDTRIVLNFEPAPVQRHALEAAGALRVRLDPGGMELRLTAPIGLVGSQSSHHVQISNVGDRLPTPNYNLLAPVKVPSVPATCGASGTAPAERTGASARKTARLGTGPIVGSSR